MNVFLITFSHFILLSFNINAQIRNQRSVFLFKSNKANATNSTIHWPHVTDIASNKPRFFSTFGTNINFDINIYQCSLLDDNATCSEKIQKHKTRILHEFERALSQNPFQKNVYPINPYKVDYDPTREYYFNETSKELICALRNVKIDTINSEDISSERFTIKKWLPAMKIFEKDHFNTCAIIASAGSLLGSGLGRFIGKQKYFMKLSNRKNAN